MSVFDGEIEYQSVYMVDFVKKNKPYGQTTLFRLRVARFNLDEVDTGALVIQEDPKRLKPPPKDFGSKSPRRKRIDDDCLIVGLSRDMLKAKDVPRKLPDKLCPISHEYYKNAVQRFAEEYPKITKMYMSKDIDATPIENEIKDLKRTEYLTKYCSRDLPFMSVNLARRARALQTLRLPDDVIIPDTTQKGAFRPPRPEKYADPPSTMSMRPKYDDSLTKELRRILRVNTGDTTYGTCHGLLAKVVLEKNPFGKPRKEPRYGRWKNPYIFTYRI